MQECVDPAAAWRPHIQLAGYDVYYEDKTVPSRELFIENLDKVVKIMQQPNKSCCPLRL